MTPDPQQAAKERIDKLVALGTPDALAVADQLGQAFGVKFDKPMPPKTHGLPDAPKPEAAPSGPTLGDVEGNKPPKEDDQAKLRRQLAEAEAAKPGPWSTVAHSLADVYSAGLAAPMMGLGAGARAVEEMAPEVTKHVDAMRKAVIPGFDPAEPMPYTSQTGRGLRAPAAPLRQMDPRTDAQAIGQRLAVRREAEHRGSTSGENVSAPKTSYKSGLDEFRRETNEARAAAPGLAMATEYIGGAPLMALGPEEGAAGQALRIGQRELPSAMGAVPRMLKAGASGTAQGAGMGAVSALGHDEPVAPAALGGGLMGGAAALGLEGIMSGTTRPLGSKIWERQLDPQTSPASARIAQVAEWGGVEPSLTAPYGTGGLKPGPAIEAAYEAARANRSLSPAYLAEKNAARDLQRGIESFAKSKLEPGRRAKEIAFTHSPTQSAEPLYERWNSVLQKRVFDDGTPIPTEAAQTVKSKMNALIEKVSSESHEGFGLHEPEPVSPTGPTELDLPKASDANVTQAKSRGARAKPKREAGRGVRMGDEGERRLRDLTVQDVEKIRAGLAGMIKDYGESTSAKKSSEQRAVEEMYDQTRDYIDKHFNLLHQANQTAAPHIEELRDALSALKIDPDKKFSPDPTKEAFSYKDLSPDLIHSTELIAKYSEHMPTTEAIDKVLNQSPTLLKTVRAARSVRAYEQLTQKGGGVTASVNSNLTPVIRLGDIGRPAMTRLAGLKNVKPGGLAPEAARITGERAGTEQGEQATDEDVQTVMAMFHLGRMAEK